MKTLSDDQGKEFLPGVTPYTITTTPEDILSAYEKRQSRAFSKKPSLWKPLLIGGASLGAVAVAVSFLLLFPPSATPDDPKFTTLPETFSPVKNKTLSQEFIAFQAFGPSANSDVNALARKAREGEKDDEEDEQEGFSQAAFAQIVDDYETVQEGVYRMFANTNERVEEIVLEEPFVYQGNSYDIEVRFYGENEEILSRLFYVQESIKENHHETERKMTGIFVHRDLFYKATIEEESESHEGKDESEVKVLLESTDGSSLVYAMERELEYRGKHSEEAYSYSVFPSLEYYRKGEKNFLSSIQIEWEDEELNVNVEKPSSEAQFSTIQQIDDWHFSFLVEEYEWEGENVEDLLVHLTYQEDSSRTYVCDPYTEVRK